jgi:hypothetical protein
MELTHRMSIPSKYCLHTLRLAILLLFCIKAPIAFAHNFVEREPLRFAKVVASANQNVAFLLLQEIYKRAGIAISARNMSSKRSLAQTSRGQMDGEILRIKSVEKHYPTLIRIPTAVYHIQTQLFTAQENLSNQEINDQLWISNKFATVSGVLHSEQLVKKHNIQNVQKLVDLKQMLTFVSLGRADIGITSRLNGLRYLNQHPKCRFRILNQPLKTQALYHYLHQKHRLLVPVINSIIQEMYISGELKTLTEEFEQQVLQEPY